MEFIRNDEILELKNVVIEIMNLIYELIIDSIVEWSFNIRIMESEWNRSNIRRDIGKEYFKLD